MTEERIEARNVSLYPDDWQIVNNAAQQTGVRSISAALRIIIRQWITAQQENAHVINCQQAPQQDAAPAM